MNKLFTFDDVLIEPKFSTIESRKDVDLTTYIAGIALKLPIISANMDTVTGDKMAIAMAKQDAIGCLHRFCTIEENLKMFEKALHGGAFPMVSIGLGEKELERAKVLYRAGATNFVIDVANGASTNVVKQAIALRDIGYDFDIMVGNFATAQSVAIFLEHVGDGFVNAVKVGIGPGSACTTRIKAGVGVPQLSAILEIASLLKDTGIKVIADGGMRTPGDIAKALGAGADLVMLGGMLAGTEETPGETYYVDTLGRAVAPRDFLSQKVELDGSVTLVRDTYSESFPKVKKYRGSASKESYALQGKEATHRTAEGESFLVPYKGPVSEILQDIEGGLRSALTYTNSRNLKEFKQNCNLLPVSTISMRESGAHGKNEK